MAHEARRTPSSEESIARWQKRLIKEIEAAWGGHKVGTALRTALINCPRHLFIERYKLKNETAWQEVRPENLGSHLSRIYQDEPLALVHPIGDVVLSAQSKPSFIFSLLNQLRIEPGQTVLEIGSGSGWLAAVIASLVGPEGQVFGLEILHELAELSQNALAKAGVQNLRIIEGDAISGYPDGAPYDCVVITARAPEVPAWLFEQLKVGGRLIVPIEVPGGGDCMFLMERDNYCLRSKLSMYSLSVPMSGHLGGGLRPPYLWTRSDAERIKSLPTIRIPWPSTSSGHPYFLQETVACRAFLAATEDDFIVYNLGTPGAPLTQNNLGFGIEDHENGSLALATAGGILTFGAPSARDRLMSVIAKWSKLSASGLIMPELKVYPLYTKINLGEGDCLRHGAESSYVWKFSAS